MAYEQPVREFHPRKSGLRKMEGSNFSLFLVGIFQTIRGSRRRVKLVELQAALLRRGWHP